MGVVPNAASVFGIGSTPAMLSAARTSSSCSDFTPAPRRSECWLHEVKFDGWRIELRKHGGSAALYTNYGHGHSSRVRWMADAIARLASVRSLVIDGELVACDNAGLRDFYALATKLIA
jgi:ATP-dependent DNA ligase